MTFEAMFFDLDDTLYPSTCGIWQAIAKRMDEYIVQKSITPPEKVKILRENLLQEYGTTLRGLRALYGIDESDFLEYVHDVPLNSFLKKDELLVETLNIYPGRKIIFTNSSKAHAERVISILGLDGVFSDIIDVQQISPYCKPLPEAYNKALAITAVKDPSTCVMIDDSARNLKTAHEMGFYTIQVGSENRSPYADAAVVSVADLPNVIPLVSYSPGVR